MKPRNTRQILRRVLLSYRALLTEPMAFLGLFIVSANSRKGLLRYFAVTSRNQYESGTKAREENIKGSSEIDFIIAVRLKHVKQPL